MAPRKNTPLPEDHVALSRPLLVELINENRISESLFQAGDFNGKNGFVLIVKFQAKLDADDEDGRKSRLGIYYKQDSMPRVFPSPEALMGNAYKLGIKHYSVDASLWRREYYNRYEAQAEIHKKHREQGGK